MFREDKMDLNETNLNMSCDVYICKKTAQILFPMFYIVVFIVSISGNILVLYVTFQKQQKFNSTTLYLINLAISDTLFALALPGRITYYIRGFDWPFGDLMCRLTTVIFYTNTYVGIAFMTCISVDRYFAMVHPHRLVKFRKVEVVKVICGLVWMMVFLQTAPLLFRTLLGKNKDKRTCMEYFNFDGSPFLPYLLLAACTISFCMPLGIILGCYSKINLKLSSTARANPMTSRSGRNQRANNVILLILFTFVVCFSPYHINIMQFMMRRIMYVPTCEELKAFKMSLQVTVSIMNINCCLDPIIYFFAIKTYKQRVLSLFKGYLSTSTFSSKTISDNSSSNS
ncbi:G-protein coupled receptor 183 [Amia ocellicauda]|uniref:G-protein coupled receptor 183 n=1 Tax=Amia ocellicauda TaxID=2972642 RepID=UPI0034649811